MKSLRRLGYVALALLAVGAVGYWWVFVETHRAAAGRYAIDIAEVRRLADSLPGDKPQALRVETVAHLDAPGALIVAGDRWRTVDLPVSSYELVYPDHLAVIDTAFDTRIGKSMGASRFDPAAYARMSATLAKASLVLVTHEHPDHVGGLLAQPDPKRLLAVARLTREQVDGLKANLTADPFGGLHLQPGLFDGYAPLDYRRYLAIAPGVVLIKSPGHTPGSQMIYVRRADGSEILFLGDVAWRMANVETQREKARLAALIAGEDRGKVRRELAGLNQLHAAAPAIHMMPGHDAEALATFVKNGWLVQGF